jgi:peptidoglycan hydrolase FlgJ
MRLDGANPLTAGAGGAATPAGEAGAADSAVASRARRVTSGGRADARAEAEVRRVAAEFEALLLTQMTSRLNPASDDEGGLFGGGDDAGASGLYRQMFSEQLARTMAEGGGVGIADMMLNHLRAKTSGPAGGLARAFDAARGLARRRGEDGGSPAVSEGMKDEGERMKGEKLKASPSTHHSSLITHHSSLITPDDIYLVSEADAMLPAGVDLRAPDAVRPRRVFPVSDSAPSAPAPAAGGASEPVVYRLPVEGEFRSNFGLRRDPFTGARRFHHGVDIAAPRGTPIAAAADGTVVFSGSQRGYGRTVVLEHEDGRRTRYAHAETLHVSAGERVRAGQTIAAVGSTGRSTGPHLHFEVTENGQAVNPSTIFAKAPSLARR